MTIEVVEKPIVLLAYFHDGSAASANAIREWFLSNREGAFCEMVYKSETKMQTVYFLDSLGPVGRQIVFPGWWIVRQNDGSFIALSDKAFEEKYARVARDAHVKM